VRLIGVLNAREDYAGLVGLEGELQGGTAGRLFFDAGGGLTMPAAEVTRGEAVVTVRTGLGNTFVFRLLEGA